MARLVGVGLLFWAVYTSLTYAVEHAPGPASATATAPDRPSPVDALSEATADPDPAAGPSHPGPAWPPGAYRVGASTDERIAAADTDYRASEEVFTDDDRDVTDDGRAGGTGDGRAGGTSRADSAGGRVNTTPRAVVGEIAPGLYATAFDVEDCTYELWRVMQDRQPKVIAEEYLAQGRLLVSINGIEPDWFTATEGCGSWHRWRPVPDPLTQAGNGDYWLGELASGVWLVPAPCRWDEVVAFRGAALHDVVDSGTGPGSLTVDVDTLGLRIRGCRSPIRLISGDT